MIRKFTPMTNEKKVFLIFQADKKSGYKFTYNSVKFSGRRALYGQKGHRVWNTEKEKLSLRKAYSPDRRQ